MIREIFPNIFQIKVPLPYNPLGHLNSYLVRSEGKNLLIDTGLDFPQAFQVLRNGLKKAGVKNEDMIEILLTHFHADHVGLIGRIRKTTGNFKLMIHRVEAELSRVIVGGSEEYREKMKAFLETNGAPSSLVRNLERFHPAFQTPEAYKELATASVSLEDNQVIPVGDHNLQVLWTPGHSPGHICLYETSLKILFSGDHLLPNITPHVAKFLEDMNPLKDYMKSLDRTRKLEVDVVLPAHEKTFKNHRLRIRQLKLHHNQRLAQLRDKLKARSSTAYTLASRIHWDVDYESWEKFPQFQKYLALGETVAHLNLLEERRLVRRKIVDKTHIYYAN